MIALLAGCTVAETAANQTETSKPEQEKTVTQEKNAETECKICDYDFEKYKGELSKKEIDGLLLALNDEYMAIATYQKINKKFDDPRPFVNIVKAEQRHAGKLKELFTKYKLEIPEENPWIGGTPDYESVKLACKAGIDAEVQNVALYDRLFKTTDREDILFVYKNLRRASQENHKPAFERCSSRGDGNGRGRGRGMGRGKNNQ